MKKLILIFMIFFAAGVSAFADDFDKNAYTEKTISEEKKMIETDYKDNIQGIDGMRIKSKCHIYRIDPYENILVFYGDGAKTPIEWYGEIYFPQDLPLFTSLIIYYHHESYYEDYYKKWFYRDELDGWEVVDDVRFTGQKYIATDNLKIRAEPSLNAEKIGLIKKDDYAKILEVGEKITIDGIESAWVKVRTQDGKEGWCFAGYLTDGTEYRTKPWTSKAE